MKHFFLLLLAFTISLASFAQQSKIKELEKQRKQTLLEISNTDKLLRDTKKSTTNLLNRIKMLSSQISSRKKVVTLLGQEVDGLGIEQLKIEKEIIILQNELKDKQGSYAKAVDGLLRNRQSENKLLFVLSGKSMSESYRRLRYLKNYSEWRSSQAEEIKDKSAELRRKKEELVKAKSEKIALLKQREIEQGNLKKEESNYQNEAKEAQSKQKELQSILSEKRKQANALDKQIERLIKEDIARQEREREKARERERQKEQERNKDKGGKTQSQSQSQSTTKTPQKASSAAPTITREDARLSGSFEANKGKLPFPLTGNCQIVTQFGTHRNEQWKVSTTSNGIDIQSQSGAEARAVFEGEVTLVAAFAGYNNCVIVRHGGYYTFYGNIQNLAVKQGDKVKINQSLGRVFTDPDTNRSEMHFQLWKGTTKLNPAPWLKR